MAYSTNKRPSLTGRLTEPQVLLDTKRLMQYVLKGEQPEAVQYEQYPAGRRWVLHLTNHHRVEIFVPNET